MYRAQQIVSLCRDCHRDAAAACFRCGVPLCASHDHGEESRCRACEEAYDEISLERATAELSGSLSQYLRAFGYVSGFLGLLTYAFVSGVALSLPPVVASLVSLLGFAGGTALAAAWWQQRRDDQSEVRRRHVFLREHEQSSALLMSSSESV